MGNRECVYVLVSEKRKNERRCHQGHVKIHFAVSEQKNFAPSVFKIIQKTIIDVVVVVVVVVVGTNCWNGNAGHNEISLKSLFFHCVQFSMRL